MTPEGSPGFIFTKRQALGKSDKSNLVCLMDLLFLVPKGVSAQLGSFYQRLPGRFVELTPWVIQMQQIWC